VTRRAFFALFVAVSLPSWTAEPGAPAGVPNFHPVNDHIYRGAQPTAEGFANLSKLGVKTVIDLRRGSDHEKTEQSIVEHAGMQYVHVPLSGRNAPTDEQVAKLMALLDESDTWPVFVHCKRGADRTGTIIACYRIRHDGWPNKKALDEAKIHGMSWTEIFMQEYVMRFHPPAEHAVILPK
jgi:uncharacterized protein (TIGR01244 family)